MNSQKKFLTLAVVPFLLMACDNKIDTINASQKDTVTVTFTQHPFLRASYDENGNGNGYYFRNEIIETSEIIYTSGYCLTKENIDDLTKCIKYKVPDLNGDGYWSFTFFVTSFDKETGFASDYLEPTIIDHNFEVHFAIYG